MRRCNPFEDPQSKCLNSNDLHSTRSSRKKGLRKILPLLYVFFKKPPRYTIWYRLPECIHKRVQLCKGLIDSHSKTPASDGLCQCPVTPATSHSKTLAKDGSCPCQCACQMQKETKDKLCECQVASRDKPLAKDGLYQCSVFQADSKGGPCQCRGACQTETDPQYGLCKRQVALHVQNLLCSHGRPGRPISESINRFESIKELWKVLDRKGDDFASIEELSWLVEDVGQSLKEVISGQKKYNEGRS